MSLYLHRKNNLADVQNIFEARRNLGFGSLANFDSNNVTIDGGSISIDHFKLVSENVGVNKFLICKSNDGTVDFVDVEMGNWINCNLEDIKFSDFDTSDVVFQNCNLLQSIAFSANYNDLLNKPTLFSHLSNDLDFLHKDINNIDVNGAITNLGLGSLAFIDSSDAITLNNLTINGNLIFPNIEIDDNPKYLYIQPDGSTYWTSLKKASSTEYGVVKLSHAFTDNDSNVAASIIAVNEMEQTIRSLLNNIGNVSLAAEIQETIINSGLMKKTNNLSELTDLRQARANLGFNTNMESLISSINNNNSFAIRNLYVNSNIQFVNPNNANLQFTNDFYLSVNTQGQIIPKQLIYGSETNAGFIYLTSNYDSSLLVDDRIVALSMYGLNDFINNVYNENYASISNSIDPKIRALYTEYMRVDDNIRVDNPSTARQHLGLHEVAHTGDFFQLSNRPVNVSTFSNDSGFMYRSNNLLDIDNINLARQNLLIGSVAYYDSNNINILGGNGTFSNLIIENHLQYKYNNSNYQNMFLKSINPNGDCRWEYLPNATSTQKGIVQLESDYRSYDDKKASTASALFKVYYKLLGEIDAIDRNISEIKLTLNIS